MPNIKFTLKKFPKTFDILPKRQNFDTSGHTAYEVGPTYFIRLDESVRK